MQSLVTSFVWFVSRIRSLVGLVIPIFADAADHRSWPRWVRVLVALVVFGVMIWALLWLNGLDPVQRNLKKYPQRWLQQTFLPLVFTLLLALTWIGYLWWKLLNAAEAEEFPDIAAAWEEARQKLARSGVTVGDLPLFLVIGRPESGEDALFLASGQKIETRVPSSSTAPIRVYAGPNAVFVTCPGASTWGRYIDRLTDPEAVTFGGPPATATAAQATITPGQALMGVDDKIQDEFYELIRQQSDRSLTDAESARLIELGELIQAAKGPVNRQVRMASDELALGPRRLAYLCRLIVRDRRPWCPVNGSLLVVPWGTLETDELGRTAVSVLATDLAIIRATLRLRYPTFVVVSDLEQASGFDEFRRGFRASELNARVGQRLPLVPDRPPADVPGMLEYAADWVRLNVIPAFVLNWLRLEWPPETRKTTLFVPGYNRKLFFFLYDVFTRGPRLGRLLAASLTPTTAQSSTDPLDHYPLVGGCYLAATGKEERNQAFVGGVFQRLTDRTSQDAVSWSEAALADDRNASRWATLLMIGAVLLAAGTAAGVWWYAGRA